MRLQRIAARRTEDELVVNMPHARQSRRQGHGALEPRALEGAKVKAGSIRSGKIIAPKLKQISNQLSDHLDTRVSVELGEQKGKIVIEFATIEDLERINTKILKNS